LLLQHISDELSRRDLFTPLGIIPDINPLTFQAEKEPTHEHPISRREADEYFW
jgi:hypothetical protein